MTRLVLQSAAWVVLAALTLWFVVTNDRPAYVVATTAWLGGLLTMQLWFEFRFWLWMRQVH